MSSSLVIGGLSGFSFVLGGIFPFEMVTPITDFADARQGTILSPDTDPIAVDPRQGTIIN